MTLCNIRTGSGVVQRLSIECEGDDVALAECVEENGSPGVYRVVPLPREALLVLADGLTAAHGMIRDDRQLRLVA